MCAKRSTKEKNAFTKKTGGTYLGLSTTRTTKRRNTTSGRFASSEKGNYGLLSLMARYQVVKDSPQPQLPLLLGFSKWNSDLQGGW